jgi:acetyl esterase/lipase
MVLILRKLRVFMFIRLAHALAVTLVPSIALGLPAQHSGHGSRNGGAAKSTNCYEPNDPTEIRLWQGHAPGAVGDDPCRDIPYIRVYPAPSAAASPLPAMLIIPGGGYDRLTDIKEQGPVAAYFSQKLHVTTFVLYYRLVQHDGTYRYPVPMWDGQRAIKLIRAQATQFGVDPKRLALFGFSAGGHLASTLTLHSATDFSLPTHDAVDSEEGRPNLLGLGYPVISMDPADVPPSGSYRNLLHSFGGVELKKLQIYLSGERNVTVRTPPVFLFESMDDKVISPENSVLFVDALKQRDISVDAYLFAHGEHGAGLAIGIPEECAWPRMFEHWLGQQNFLSN